MTDTTPILTPRPELVTPAHEGRMPALYLGHGAPTLVDDALWPVQLTQWSAELPRPKAILVVSAHWEEAPVTIGATSPVPLVYDFWGFPKRSTLTRLALLWRHAVRGAKCHHRLPKFQRIGARQTAFSRS